MVKGIECGASGCEDKVHAKFTVKCVEGKYDFHLCKTHYEIYGKAKDYELTVEKII